MLSTLSDLEQRVNDLQKRWTLKVSDLNVDKAEEKQKLVARFEQKKEVWKTEFPLMGSPIKYVLKCRPG